MTTLSADELAGFWALGIPVEASYVPDDEWLRAIAERRVQAASSYSSMGTAETGWMQVSAPTYTRGECAVVPPGQVAESTPYGDLQDDRDVIGVCWLPFWHDQQRLAVAALLALPPPRHDAFLEECARMLVELEQAWPHDRDNPQRQLLIDWLIAANAIEHDQLAAQLADIKSSSLVHLVRGVRARWLARDLHMAFDAVLASAERGKAKDWYGHGNIAHQCEVRMQLLRFIVGLVRR